MVTTLTVKVDTKGRVTIPERIRRGMKIEPGDTLFMEWDEERKVARYAKAENPFDVLAEDALEEYRAGRTQNLRDFAAESGIDLDAGRGSPDNDRSKPSSAL